VIPTRLLKRFAGPVARVLRRRGRPAPRPHPYATTYQVEVFAGCNLRCPLCHAGREEIERDARVLSLAQFEHIWEKIEPYAERLFLHIWGEPTLNKHLISMIELVSRRKPGCVTNVSTHGNGLSRDYAFRLVAAGLHQLIVSIDGFDQASYEKYRVGGNFEDARSFLRWAAEAKQELGSPILISAQCLAMRHTEAERQRYADLMGFPGVIVVHKPLWIGGYGMDYKEFVSSEIEVQVPTLSSCTALTDVVAVQADGAILPCCLYPEKASGFDLGNIFESTVPELFGMRDRAEMDRQIKSGRSPTKHCENACGHSSTAVKEQERKNSLTYRAGSLLRKYGYVP
jgi:MoaA/NifB/PqqE/SkfB family radical SAM enzyme